LAISRAAKPQLGRGGKILEDQYNTVSTHSTFNNNSENKIDIDPDKVPNVIRNASSVAALLISRMAIVAEPKLRPPADTWRPRMRMATPGLLLF
jgi:hypothetical protein